MFEVAIIKNHKEIINCVCVLEKHNVCLLVGFLFCFVLPEAMAENDLQPPNYYEVMEFDPLAPVVTTE